MNVIKVYIKTPLCYHEKPWNLFSNMVYIKVPHYYLAFWTFTIAKSYLFKDLGVPCT